MYESDELQNQDNGVEVITISHPLNMHEKEEIVYQLLSTSNLKQVYFVDNVDLATIELVKCLLEFSTNIDDLHVEKMVLVNNDTIREALSFLTYKYPDTWYLSFNNLNKSNELISLPRYRNMCNYLKNITLELNNSNYSIYEKVIKVYNIVKMFKYDEESSSNFYLPSMIEGHSSNSYGFNVLFSTLLSMINIDSYVGSYRVDDIRGSITIVDIKDEKYSINGLYLFNPAEDSSFNDIVKSGYYYNYFGLNIDDINSFKERFDLLGLLGILSIPDYSISCDKLRSYLCEIDGKKGNGLTSAFKCDFKDLYQRFHSTVSMDKKVLFSAIKNIYSDMETTYIDSLECKYIDRKNTLLNNRNILIDDINN